MNLLETLKAMSYHQGINSEVVISEKMLWDIVMKLEKYENALKFYANENFMDFEIAKQALRND